MSSSNSKASEVFNLYKEVPQKKININFSNMNKVIKKKIILLSKKKSLTPKGYRSLIRFSGTEPLIRILVESKDENLIDKYIDKTIKILQLEESSNG